MKKIFLIAILSVFIFPLYSQNNIEKNPLSQISEHFDKTDFSSITKDISVSIEVTQKDVCKYQNQYLQYGEKVYPTISDKKREKAILDLIKKIINCEPLPFKEDGQTFLNKEGKLPAMPKGYYQEYTLIIPKDADNQFYIGDTLYNAYPSYGERGPERIVIGGGKTIYYTPTHYDTFVEIKLINIKSDSN